MQEDISDGSGKESHVLEEHAIQTPDYQKKLFREFNL